MPNTIDVSGLNEQDINLLEALVKRLQKNQRKKKAEKAKEKEEVAFASWPLGVKGRLTRKEIYDYL
jgi:hypothetical protein